MPKKAFDTYRNIALMEAGTFAFLAGSIVIILMAKGLNLAEVGIYFALYSAGVFLLEVPTGAFADAYGRRKAIIISFLFQAIFLAGFLLLPNGPWFMAFALVVALADSMMSGSAEAYAVKMLEENGKLDYTHRLIASTRSWRSLLFLIGPILGGYLGLFSLDYPVLLCMAFALAGLAYSCLGLRDDTPKKHYMEAWKDITPYMKKAFAEARRNKSLSLLFVVVLIIGFGSFGLFSYWQPVLRNILGWDTFSLGLFFSLISLANIVGYKISVCLKPNWTSLALILFGLFVALSIASWATIPFALVGSVLIFEILWGAYMPIEGHITNHNAPSDIRATVISIRTMIFRVGWTAIGMAIGLVGLGEPRMLWMIGAIFLLVGAFLVLFSMRKVSSNGVTDHEAAQ